MMKYFGVRLVLIFVLSMLSSCMDGRQGNYYKSYVDAVSNPNVIALSDGQNAQLIISQDIEADQEKYQNMGFVVIGKSEFDTTDKARSLNRNVGTEGRRAFSYAKKISATHVLYLRERLGEYSTTTYDNKKDSYETEHFERFRNVSVYMVKRK